MLEIAPGTEQDDRLPIPTGWRILVRIPRMVERTAGGLYIPEEVRDAETILTTFAVVVRLGPLAYTRNDMIAADPWCDPGDTVVISKYAGTRLLVDGEEHRLVNDDEIQAVLPDPSAVKRA